MSLLDTIIRRAIASGEISALAEEPDANASKDPASPSKGNEMANENASGAANSTGIPEADHKAAVTKAEADGRAAGKAEGMKEANDRMAAVFGADGVKGDGKRMAAAIDLAMASPAMPAEAVVSFVIANVAETAKPAAAGSYEQRRLAASQLVQPGGGKPEGEADKSALAAAVDRTNKRNRR